LGWYVAIVSFGRWPSRIDQHNLACAIGALPALASVITLVVANNPALIDIQRYGIINNGIVIVPPAPRARG
jgi:hypothetical protein